MTNRIVVTLEQQEFSALLKLAEADLRSPADELRFVLRLEIERRKNEPGSLVSLVETPIYKEISNEQ